jgi:hypothetical protein
MERLWWIGLLAALLAVAAVALVRTIAVSILGTPAAFEPFQWRALITATVTSVLGAVLVFALLGGFARQPTRLFWFITALVLVLSFWFPLSLLRRDPPPFPGITRATVWVLNFMHVVVAVVTVTLLTLLGRRPHHRR